MASFPIRKVIFDQNRALRSPWAISIVFHLPSRLVRGPEEERVIGVAVSDVTYCPNGLALVIVAMARSRPSRCEPFTKRYSGKRKHSSNGRERVLELILLRTRMEYPFCPHFRRVITNPHAQTIVRRHGSTNFPVVSPVLQNIDLK
jgi:hypothetical protein